MRLVRKLRQSRRDFQGEYECEHCGHIHTDSSLSSYDDAYFHTRVIPGMACPNCGKPGAESTPRTMPDVPPDVVL